jgi:hypothetical protein
VPVVSFLPVCFATFSLLKVKTRGIPAIFLKGNTANYRDRRA